MANLQNDQITEAYKLWEQTGWNATYRISLAEFTKSWQASAVKKCIVQEGRIVAIGRANSDGILYSMIHDIVVHSDCRRKGLGRKIILEIVDELKTMNVRSIQLMAAQGQAPFYEKLGFVARPDDRPGMQYDWQLDQQPHGADGEGRRR